MWSGWGESVLKEEDSELLLVYIVPGLFGLLRSKRVCSGKLCVTLAAD